MKSRIAFSVLAFTSLHSEHSPQRRNRQLHISVTLHLLHRPQSTNLRPSSEFRREYVTDVLQPPYAVASRQFALCSCSTTSSFHFPQTIFSSSAHFLGDSGDRNPSPSSLSPEHPPLTEDAQKALDWALNEKVKEVVYFNSANVYGSCFSNAIGFWFVHRLLVFSDEIGSSWNQGNTATKKKLRICQESML
nr:ATP-dependent Clp protease ATP-binding subunit CLPT2, chloroplastic-like [Ipomoea batatas]GMD05694.1 ATP-dependent Clp protease ATP-binding subunit CLPT2, chloroplastic-like [Ipomoea batatas]GMD28753.1 ATP-dependent Clp protease ATP-binding subunit CLPT2, chloroplastic-like [Ipomoea batatas]